MLKAFVLLYCPPLLFFIVIACFFIDRYLRKKGKVGKKKFIILSQSFPTLIVGLFLVVLYEIIYGMFYRQVGFPSSINENVLTLSSSDWLSFLGSYLGFAGSMVMAVAVFLRTKRINQLDIQKYEPRLKIQLKDYIVNDIASAWFDDDFFDNLVYTRSIGGNDYPVFLQYYFWKEQEAEEWDGKKGGTKLPEKYKDGTVLKIKIAIENKGLLNLDDIRIDSVIFNIMDAANTKVNFCSASVNNAPFEREQLSLEPEGIRHLSLLLINFPYDLLFRNEKKIMYFEVTFRDNSLPKKKIDLYIDNKENICMYDGFSELIKPSLPV